MANEQTQMVDLSLLVSFVNHVQFKFNIYKTLSKKSDDDDAEEFLALIEELENTKPNEVEVKLVDNS